MSCSEDLLVPRRPNLIVDMLLVLNLSVLSALAIPRLSLTPGILGAKTPGGGTRFRFPADSKAQKVDDAATPSYLPGRSLTSGIHRRRQHQ